MLRSLILPSQFHLLLCIGLLQFIQVRCGIHKVAFSNLFEAPFEERPRSCFSPVGPFLVTVIELAIRRIADFTLLYKGAIMKHY